MQTPFRYHSVTILMPLLLTVTLAGVSGLLAKETDQPPKRTQPDGMINYIDVKYLPEERYSGDPTIRGDYEKTLSLYVPKGSKGPFPVVFFLHGGSFTFGAKEGQEPMIRELASRGIAFCAMNYILIPRGIYPQAYWDLHNAAAFLRKNASQYNIDPLRFGAYGISAGSWLISMATMPDADHWQIDFYQVKTTAQILANGGRWERGNKQATDPWWPVLKPIHDPTPAWPEEAGGFSAMSWDFQSGTAQGSDGSPTVQQWAGKGHKPAYQDKFTEAGGRLVITELTHPKFAGQGVHGPPFFNNPKDKSPDMAEAIDLDGKPGKQLGVIIGDFFVRELKSPAARPPSPQIYPIPRLIRRPTPVTMLAPRGATIHYTTDGSTPTVDSPVYSKPITVEPGTVVKAISAAPGMTHSGANSAEFLAGDPPPTVTGPEVLPPAVTGKPYSVTFTASTPKARWAVAGDLVPQVPYQKKDVWYPNGMHLDHDTGIWSGTPSEPGRYFVTMWVAEGLGRMAGYRNYVWIVTGEAIADVQPTIAGSANDPNQEFATLDGWPKERSGALLRAFTEASLRVVSQEAGKGKLMLVAHQDDRAKAEDQLKAFVAKHVDLAKRVAWARK